MIGAVARRTNPVIKGLELLVPPPNPGESGGTGG